MIQTDSFVIWNYECSFVFYQLDKWEQSSNNIFHKLFNVTGATGKSDATTEHKYSQYTLALKGEWNI